MMYAARSQDALCVVERFLHTQLFLSGTTHAHTHTRAHTPVNGKGDMDNTQTHRIYAHRHTHTNSDLPDTDAHISDNKRHSTSTHTHTHTRIRTSAIWMYYAVRNTRMKRTAFTVYVNDIKNLQYVFITSLLGAGTAPTRMLYVSMYACEGAIAKAMHAFVTCQLFRLKAKNDVNNERASNNKDNNNNNNNTNINKSIENSEKSEENKKANTGTIRAAIANNNNDNNNSVGCYDSWLFASMKPLYASFIPKQKLSVNAEETLMLALLNGNNNTNTDSNETKIKFKGDNNVVKSKCHKNNKKSANNQNKNETNNKDIKQSTKKAQQNNINANNNTKNTTSSNHPTTALHISNTTLTHKHKHKHTHKETQTYCITRLLPYHSTIVNDHWTYKGPGTNKKIRRLLRHYPAYGVFINSHAPSPLSDAHAHAPIHTHTHDQHKDNHAHTDTQTQRDTHKHTSKQPQQPVTWAVQNDCGAIGKVYTLNTHRRRGYAMMCVKAVIAHIQKLNLVPYCYIVKKNFKSIRMFTKKLHFTVCEQVVWVHVTSKSGSG